MTVTIKNAQIKNTQIGPTVASRGLVSSWNVASTYSYPRNGNILYDLIKANGNDGDMINMNSGNFNEESMGNLVLDGTNEYINIPYDASNLSLDVDTGPFSISMWISPTESLVPSSIVRKKSEYWGYGGTAGWAIELKPTATRWGFQSLGIQDDESSYARCLACAGSFEWDKWHHLSMIYNTTDRKVLLYVNANLTNELAVPAGFGSLSNARPLEIGGRVDYGLIQDPFKGSIASLYFYKSASTFEEVEQNYNATKSRFIE